MVEYICGKIRFCPEWKSEGMMDDESGDDGDKRAGVK